MCKAVNRQIMYLDETAIQFENTFWQQIIIKLRENTSLSFSIRCYNIIVIEYKGNISSDEIQLSQEPESGHIVLVIGVMYFYHTWLKWQMFG